MLVVLLLPLLAAVAQVPSSPEAPGPLLGTGVYRLVQVGSIQQELKLTPRQLAELEAVPALVRSETYVAAQGQSSGERAKLLLAAMDRRAWDLLTPDQQQRWQQIERQITVRNQGLAAVLHRPPVRAALALTPDQEAQVRAALAAQQQTVRQLFQQRDPNVRGRLDAVREEQDRKLAALFTPAQQQRWQQLIGTPFHAPDLPVRP
ncbi:MAG TPA: hypothetical protein PKD86_11100 [Gemmatales bacterium]|nr:hypothetical protein [Gemmatales bacterium]HMP59892.1 hypothetical protein [Gemmatales bacterium]